MENKLKHVISLNRTEEQILQQKFSRSNSPQFYFYFSDLSYVLVMKQLKIKRKILVSLNRRSFTIMYEKYEYSYDNKASSVINLVSFI